MVVNTELEESGVPGVVARDDGMVGGSVVKGDAE